MLGQPAGRHQTAQRPVGANHVEFDVAAIARNDVVEVLLVSERQRGEVDPGELDDLRNRPTDWSPERQTCLDLSDGESDEATAEATRPERSASILSERG